MGFWYVSIRVACLQFDDTTLTESARVWQAKIQKLYAPGSVPDGVCFSSSRGGKFFGIRCVMTLTMHNLAAGFWSGTPFCDTRGGRKTQGPVSGAADYNSLNSQNDWQPVKTTN